MSDITLTINGKQVKGKQGDTVLDICLANGIDVPTLCHYKGVSNPGACRLCLVAVEKERREVPACTYLARDGIVVTTSTEKLEKYRRLILELLFTERNHLCAYCVASGDCELQSLAYKYQMDNARYHYSWPNVITDSSHRFIVLDHNRCVLCGRCIRTCDEITGAHALDFGKRGWKTMVSADIDQPLGESSCISCGGCFQACPTGAIFSKLSAYKGKPSECSTVESSCALCGVGCDISALIKDNRLVRIDSPDMSKARGLLCDMGRFGPIFVDAERVKTPLKRNSQGKLESCTYAEAYDLISKKFASGDVTGLTTSKASSETLKAFLELMKTASSKAVDTLDGNDYRTITEGIAKFDGKMGLAIEAQLEDILTADCILVIAANPLKTHPVIGSYVMRSISKNKADLVVLDPLRNPFTFRASVWLKPAEGKEELAIKTLGKAVTDHGLAKSAGDKSKFAGEFSAVNVKKASDELGIDVHDVFKAAEILAEAKKVIIIYGRGILQYKDAGLVTTVLDLAALVSRDGNKPAVISLKRCGNSRGAWDLGVAGSKAPAGKAKNLFLLMSDDLTDAQATADNLKGFDFIAVQATYHSPVTEKASVVLPSPSWIETGGNYTTIDGKSKTTKSLVQGLAGIKSDAETLQEVSKQLKK